VSAPLSRAELFWLAYLWAVYELSEREIAAFTRFVFETYNTPRATKLHELSMRPSPMMRLLERG